MEGKADVPLGTDEREEGLCSLLNRLVECLRGRVAILAEDLVLCKEHALYKKKKRIRALRLDPSKARVLTHEYHPSTNEKTNVSSGSVIRVARGILTTPRSP